MANIALEDVDVFYVFENYRLVSFCKLKTACYQTISMKKLVIMSVVALLFSMPVNAATMPPGALKIPFTAQAPDGVWSKPWNSTCEEASVLMVDYFYKNNKITTIPAEDSKKAMLTLVKWENENFGFNADTNAEKTVKMIENNTVFNARIKTKPTLQNIKDEIKKGRPVITMNYGRALKNSSIPFSRRGSSYHVLVIKGFDNRTNEFIVNDPGDSKTGLSHRYNYDTFLASLHDFDYKTKKADGLPTVLFTSPKE